MIDRLPSISVVIPTIDRLPRVLTTVQLLQKQRVKPAEIIVIDQTASYGPKEREIVSILEAISGVCFIRQQEPSASRARNIGLQRASGEIVLFIDDDVDFDESFVLDHATNYVNSGVTAVAGQVRTGRGIVSKRKLLSKLSNIGWLVFPFNYDQRCFVETGMAGNLSVRREAAIAVGGMDERYERGGFREEADFCARLVRRYGPLLFDPAPSVESLKWSVGGIRSTSQDHHLKCEFYFIFKNVPVFFRPCHVAYAVYRQWYLQPQLRSFVFRAVPHLWSCAFDAWRTVGLGPKYFNSDCSKSSEMRHA